MSLALLSLKSLQSFLRSYKNLCPQAQTLASPHPTEDPLLPSCPLPCNSSKRRPDLPSFCTFLYPLFHLETDSAQRFFRGWDPWSQDGRGPPQAYGGFLSSMASARSDPKSLPFMKQRPEAPAKCPLSPHEDKFSAGPHVSPEKEQDQPGHQVSFCLSGVRARHRDRSLPA